MLCLPGSPALSEFRLSKLKHQLTAAGVTVNGLASRYLHLIDSGAHILDERERNILHTLLTYGPRMQDEQVDGIEFYVVPRPGTISPWASKATDIAHNCGLNQVKRIERGILFTIATPDEVPVDLLHDRMIEAVFANLDGLNDYDEDFNVIDTLITAAQTNYKVGKGRVSDEDEESLEEDVSDEEVENADPASSSIDEDGPSKKIETTSPAQQSQIAENEQDENDVGDGDEEIG